MPTQTEAHAKFERTSEIDPIKVEAIVNAKKNQLTSTSAAVRSGILSAIRTGNSVFVGHNYAGWFAGSDPTRGGEAVMFEATPDGAVFRVQMILAHA